MRALQPGIPGNRVSQRWKIFGLVDGLNPSRRDCGHFPPSLRSYGETGCSALRHTRNVQSSTRKGENYLEWMLKMYARRKRFKMSRIDETEVLVVGAGPTGMLTALVLAEAGVQVRIIDKEYRTAAH